MSPNQRVPKVSFCMNHENLDLDRPSCLDDTSVQDDTFDSSVMGMKTLKVSTTAGRSTLPSSVGPFINEVVSPQRVPLDLGNKVALTSRNQQLYRDLATLGVAVIPDPRIRSDDLFPHFDIVDVPVRKANKQRKQKPINMATGRTLNKKKLRMAT